MRRWAATTPLACASIVFGIRAGAAGTPPRRPALDEARPHSIKFIESSISVRPDTVTDSAGVATVVARCRIGVTVRHASRKPVWVRVHFESDDGLVGGGGYGRHVGIIEQWPVVSDQWSETRIPDQKNHGSIS